MSKGLIIISQINSLRVFFFQSSVQFEKVNHNAVLPTYFDQLQVQKLSTVAKIHTHNLSFNFPMSFGFFPSRHNVSGHHSKPNPV